MAALEPETACEHAYGEGYYDLEMGTRVKRTQVCRKCGDVKETDLTKEPKSAKPKGPSITGLSSGERFSR